MIINRLLKFGQAKKLELVASRAAVSERRGRWRTEGSKRSITLTEKRGVGPGGDTMD